MTERIRVHICDDHALVRAGLRRLLDEVDAVVTAEAATAEEALTLLADDPPDVLLLDVVLPGRSGIDALPDIAATAPATKVIVLSMQDDPAYVRSAFGAGASGYLLKEAAGSDLARAIREVVAGQRYLHPLLGARLVADESPQSRQADPLSRREREVLRLLALGHTNHESAKLLSVSVRTVETHRARLMQKLGLRTRAEIVRYALGAGELDRDRRDLAG